MTDCSMGAKCDVGTICCLYCSHIGKHRKCYHPKYKNAGLPYGCKWITDKRINSVEDCIIIRISASLGKDDQD